MGSDLLNPVEDAHVRLVLGVEEVQVQLRGDLGGEGEKDVGRIGGWCRPISTQKGRPHPPPHHTIDTVSTGRTMIGTFG